MSSDFPYPAREAITVSAVVARAAIASCMLGADTRSRASSGHRLGRITLHPHQASAAARIGSVIRVFGGALLCDPVGLGKTYTALAVAVAFDPVLVIAPAVLRSMWRQALAATCSEADFASFEALSRSGTIVRRYGLVIIDEAHHVRNPCTRRYAEIARACALAPVLLLSATPLHNSRADVESLVALFMGSRAYDLDDEQLSRIMIRRDSATSATATSSPSVPAEGAPIPHVEHATPTIAISDESMLDRILALPPPLPPADGALAATLIAHSLVRQWVSSDAALLGAIRRRLGQAYALDASLRAGRYPTRGELSAWVYAEKTLQLAFPELLPPADWSVTELADSVNAHITALNELIHHVQPRDDDTRISILHAIAARHPGEKIIAFTCFADTARAIYTALRADGRAAMLTASGGVIAGGRVSRQELLARFAPRASGTSIPAPCDSVDLVVATDLLSEGVNLQDASVIVHLDLPWTGARIEQRVGRLARLGSAHDHVTSYAIVPPPRADAFLRATEILASKYRASRGVTGGASHEVGATRPAIGRATVEIAECVRRTLSDWLDDNNAGADAPVFPPTRVAAVSAVTGGVLAACIVDGAPTLVTIDEHGAAATDPARVEPALALALGCDLHAQDPEVAMAADAAHIALAAWYRDRCAEADAGLGMLQTHRPRAASRRAVIRRVITSGADAPFAQRASSAAAAERVLRAVGQPLPIGIERELDVGRSDELRRAWPAWPGRCP